MDAPSRASPHRAGRAAGAQGKRLLQKHSTQQSHPQQTRALYCFIVELKLFIYFLSLAGSAGLGEMIELISAVAAALRLWLSTVGQGGDGKNHVLFVKGKRTFARK